MARGNAPKSRAPSQRQLRVGELLREALGEHILNSVIQNKNMEWAEYRATVTDYETARYLPIL